MPSESGPVVEHRRSSLQVVEPPCSAVQPSEPSPDARETVLGGVLRACAVEEGGMRALARRIGLSHQTVYDVLTGARKPGRHAGRAIADYLSGRRGTEDHVITPAVVDAWASEVATP